MIPEDWPASECSALFYLVGPWAAQPSMAVIRIRLDVGTVTVEPLAGEEDLRAPVSCCMDLVPISKDDQQWVFDSIITSTVTYQEFQLKTYRRWFKYHREMAAIVAYHQRDFFEHVAQGDPNLAIEPVEPPVGGSQQRCIGCGDPFSGPPRPW
jgi:hypothetical protein